VADHTPLHFKLGAFPPDLPSFIYVEDSALFTAEELYCLIYFFGNSDSRIGGRYKVTLHSGVITILESPKTINSCCLVGADVHFLRIQTSSSQQYKPHSTAALTNGIIGSQAC
jgi:hypothetical protein